MFGNQKKMFAHFVEVVRRQSELVLRDLKATTVRPTGGEGLAQACGAFDEPRFVAGVVSLKPGAMKDEEGVNNCSQVFIIRRGQKNSVEFTINKDVFLLSAGPAIPWLSAENWWPLHFLVVSKHRSS